MKTQEIINRFCKENVERLLPVVEQDGRFEKSFLFNFKDSLLDSIRVSFVGATDKGIEKYEIHCLDLNSRSAQFKNWSTLMSLGLDKDGEVKYMSVLGSGFFSYYPTEEDVDRYIAEHIIADSILFTNRTRIAIYG